MTRSPQSISLSGSFALAKCEQHQAELRAALERGGDVEIEIPSQAEPDLAFLQLLVATQRSAAGRGQTVRLAAPPSAAFAAALRSCGFRFAADETALDRILAPQAGATP